MYIIYSNNLKQQDVSSRGPQYRIRDDAISNLQTEAENYLKYLKRVENFKVVEKLNRGTIIDDVEWYIERTTDTSVSLYHASKISSFWNKDYHLEKCFIFSVMDLPDRYTKTEEMYEREETKTDKKERPTIRNSEMYDELITVLDKRRIMIE